MPGAADLEAVRKEWPRYQYRARLMRVKDGDTAVLRIDLGFSIFTEISVRFMGYNAPELGGVNNHGVAAKAFLCSMLEGTDLFIRTHKDSRSFERYLAEVFVFMDLDGQLVPVAELMRAAGFDVPQGD